MIKGLKHQPKVSYGSQLELPILREPEADRNLSKGGRSFYFFDFDDNIAVLTTPTVIVHKSTGHEVFLSSREFAEAGSTLGRSGPYKDYRLDFDDDRGSFRFFRDRDVGLIQKLLGKKQFFIEDLMAALGLPEFQWQGPSWSCFYHAVYNGRPTSLITARGHHPDTLKQGIELMVRQGHLPCLPNYLSLFPVNHPPTRAQLIGQTERPYTVPELKRLAVRSSFQAAIDRYGCNPYHRFGMSDDDPQNIEWIVEEMMALKKNFPSMSFFVISTSKARFVKREIFADGVEKQVLEKQQMVLF